MKTSNDEARDADLWEQLHAARRHVEAVRRLARERKVGAAEVSTAEYALAGVLRRLDALGWQPPSEPNPDDGQDAA